MIIHIIRILYLVVVLAYTVSFALQQEVYKNGVLYASFYVVIPTLVAFALIMVDMFWRKKNLQALSGLFFGVLAGLAIAYVLAQVVNLSVTVFSGGLAAHKGAEAAPMQVNVTVSSPSAAETRPSAASGETTAGRPARASAHATEEAQADPIVSLIKVLLGVSAVFMCVSFVIQTKDDFRFVIPYVEFSKQTKGARPLLLDTSVIIDGRIADIADTQLLESELIVPRFILAELQSIADSEDKLKRNRGRRGLDVLNRLQGNDKIEIRITDARTQTVEEAPDVDAKLVALAKHMDARVVTNDYNLNKVAQLRGVDVVNINDLANALKPIVLPGEAMSVKIIKQGEEMGQGVGYLDDGTMVVAEQGRDYIGREIAITVTSVLQTSAGRMIFGKLDAAKTLSHQARK